MVGRQERETTARGGRGAGAWAALLICGLAFSGVLVSVGRIGVRLESHPWLYVPRYLLLFALYLTAGALVRALLRGRVGRAGRLLPAILGFALAFRVLAVLQYPSLSTDLFRYLWDGRVGATGANPYAHPPSAREADRWDPLRSGSRRRVALTPPPRATEWLYGRRADSTASIAINHPTWVTMYPPLSQRFFALVYRLAGGNLWGLKLSFLLVDLGCIGLLAALLARAGRRLEEVVWYAWHPLPILEVSASGHQDILGVLFALGAVYLASGALGRRSAFGSGAAAGLSLMSKGYLLPALPVLARRLPVAFALGLVPVVALLVWPYTGPGSQILTGLSQYAGNRLRNAGPFAATDTLLSLLTADHLRWTRLVMLVLLAAVVLRLSWKPARDAADLVERTCAAMGAFFLLSHTVYPWYGVWLAPLFPFRLHPAWLAFTGLLPLAYLNPVPGQNDWVPFVEYGVVLVLMVRVGLRGAGPSRAEG